jgi:hypothetical protein
VATFYIPLLKKKDLQAQYASSSGSRANSTDAPVDANVVLRGKKNLAIWNPHTGEKSKAQITSSEVAGQPVTTVRLVLPAVTSVFFVEEN